MWIWHAFFRDVDLRSRVVFDPFCGIGRVLDAARRAGYETWGRDVVRRGGLNPFHNFMRADYRNLKVNPFGQDFSVVTNPAFSLVDQLLLDITSWLAKPAALFLPITYLAGKAALLERAPLSQVLVCKPRPSCPPPLALKRSGGKMDYAVYLFRPGTAPGTATLGWLRRDG